MRKATVHPAARDTIVRVGSGLLSCLGDCLCQARRGTASGLAALITDSNVGPLYLPQVRKSLANAGFHVLDKTIAPGEGSKSLSAAGELYTWLAANHIGRDDTIVALGGGVVSDLAGFVAATWMRGISWAVCPTTLEAAVDACFGGKTGISIAGTKNLVGAFHAPLIIVADPDCLRTLDARDVRAGLAESIKHALIASEEFVQWHEAHANAVLALSTDVLADLMDKNLSIKAGIVQQDPFETLGVREHLNFGHTLGHAIEARCHGKLRHGECVALGMLAACRLSCDLEMLGTETVTRLEMLLSRFGLPVKLKTLIPAEQIMDTLRSDKKNRGGRLRLVLLRSVGDPVIRDDVRDEHILAAYQSLL